ncbi:transmembrane channel-like protein 7 [Lampetra fluviatilis]
MASVSSTQASEGNDDVFSGDGGGGTDATLANEVLRQLPSYRTMTMTLRVARRASARTLARRRSTSRARGASLASELTAGDGTDSAPNAAGVAQAAPAPVRDITVCMAAKRVERIRRKDSSAQLTTWQGWKRSQWKSLKRLNTSVKSWLKGLVLWRSSIHQIEGKFGTGIQAYFSFLRFLVVLNAVIFLLMLFFVTVPAIVGQHVAHPSSSSATTALASTNDTSDMNRNANSNANVSAEAQRTINPVCAKYDPTNSGLVHYYHRILDLLSGTGFLEPTSLFYGFYGTGSYDLPADVRYNLPLAYLLTTLAYLVLSLVWIVKRSAEGFKHSLVQTEERFCNYCNKVFSGWDFCISDPDAAALKQSSISFELQADLEEEKIRSNIRGRSAMERLRIYSLRVLLNVVVLGLLAASFYSIYVATIDSQALLMQHAATEQKSRFIVSLVVEYLPSIVITAANFLMPVLFEVIITFEDYTPDFEIKLLLIRTVFLKLASIAVLLVSLWIQIVRCDGVVCEPCGYNHKTYPCWENRVGQEMYKLTIFDFIIFVAMVLFIEFPRKIIVTYCPFKIVQLVGTQEFSIPQNVLSIVYSQTICWIGAFFSPLIPLIAMIKYIIFFYLKKLSLFENCLPSVRPFRASSSNFFFLLVLLLGLVLAAVPVGYSVASMAPSQSCGPFRGAVRVWDVVPASMRSLPPAAQKLLNVLSSEAFAVPLFILICLVLFYLIALAGAHKRVIHQLREQLAMEAKDKQFLITKLMEMQSSGPSQSEKRRASVRERASRAARGGGRADDPTRPPLPGAVC